MPRVIRVMMDNAQSHGYTPLGMVATGSPDVMVNNAPCARVDDPYTPGVHCIPFYCHPIGTAVQGSPDVFANAKPVHRDTDLIQCGTVADNGSPDVFANGGGSSNFTYNADGGSGDTGGNVIGYVPGEARIEYLKTNGAQRTVCSGIPFSIGPFDGVEHAGYVQIKDEADTVVAKSYSNIGVFPPADFLSSYWDAPIILTYEFVVVGTMSSATLTLDPDTGQLSGIANGVGTINVRATHHLFDDLPEEGTNQAGTQGPWVRIPVIDPSPGDTCH
tara:strand:+ start:68 stop:889 length:822 start_codon:yes stop_codon:yes gene_type:complete